MLRPDSETQRIHNDDGSISFAALFESLNNERDIESLALRLFEALHGEGATLKEPEKFIEFSSSLKLQLEHASPEERSEILTDYTTLLLQEASTNPECAQNITKQLLAHHLRSTANSNSAIATKIGKYKSFLSGFEIGLPVGGHWTSTSSASSDIALEIHSSKSNEQSSSTTNNKSYINLPQPQTHQKRGVGLDSLLLIETQEVLHKRTRKEYLDRLLQSLSDFEAAKRKEEEKELQERRAFYPFFEPTGQYEKMVILMREASIILHTGLKPEAFQVLTKLSERLEQRDYLAMGYQANPSVADITALVRRDLDSDLVAA